MSWDAVGAIAELFGAVGVIASLFYLGSQIRRNSQSVEAATALAISEATQQRLLAPAQNTSLAVCFTKFDAREQLTPVERVQLAFFSRASIRGIENSFVQHNRGMIPDEVWLAYESLLRKQLRLVGELGWWPADRDTFDPRFRETVDRLFAEHPDD
jgi:hypothetical protein